jgi:hypothetical protein
VRSSLEKNPTQKRAGGMDQVVRVWGPEFKFQCSKKKNHLNLKFWQQCQTVFQRC